MLNEFKKFAMRGNVVDLAVGFILGGAFSTIVKSLVDDILMPPLGLMLGGVDFTNLYIVLGEGEYQSLAAAQEAGLRPSIMACSSTTSSPSSSLHSRCS